MTAKELGDISYILTAVALMLLAGGFLVLTRWRKTVLGVTLAAFLAAIFLIMAWTFLILTGIVSRDAPWLYMLRAILFGALCVSSWWMLIGFVRVQLIVRKKVDQHDTTGDQPGGRRWDVPQ